MALSADEIGLLFTNLFQAELVGFLVALGSECPDRRAFFLIEESELDSGQVGVEADFAAQGVDLADQVSFGQATDGGVARHLSDGIEVQGQEERLTPQPGGGECSFDTGVSATDDDGIVLMWESIHGWESASWGTGVRTGKKDRARSQRMTFEPGEFSEYN